ncbi:MAG: RdgB/HAM1 family non-canonical purine NTP pyrophosphatase [Gammaproteobacteria bacterium]|nr:RdgB/HAM1 family non-canonical purine NTP pyrophosphatase [Gammaproteobacteria bacterium]
MTDERRRIVLATGNRGKIEELRQLLVPLGLDCIAQGELGISAARETGESFVENAIIKARQAARATGLPALADDSGLAVDALAGAPGVYSARYAGPGASDEDNVGKLLAALSDTPAAQRSACFHCVVVYLRHGNDPVPIIGHGSWAGTVLERPVGTAGFGYDSVFGVPEYPGRSAAELEPDDKNRWSHRGKALAQLLRMFEN